MQPRAVASAASSTLAAASARAGSIQAKACTSGSRAAIGPRQASISATGLSRPAAIAAPRYRLSRRLCQGRRVIAPPLGKWWRDAAQAFMVAGWMTPSFS